MTADPKIGDRVHEPWGGMVGTVTEWWRDDRGCWVEVRFDDGAGLLGEDFLPGVPPVVPNSDTRSPSGRDHRREP